MTARRRFDWIVLVALTVGVGCRGANPASPTDVLTGRWTGTIVDNASGTGTAVLTIAQVGPGLSGGWSTTFPGTGTISLGSLSGTLVGSSASLFLAPSTPTICAPDVTLSGTIAVTATVAGGTLTGTFVVFTCDGARTGSIEVQKA